MTVHPHGRGDNARACSLCTRIPAVHPHGRGDNAAALARAVVGYGSPPRAWGQLRGRPPTGAGDRFTPTGVGTMLQRAGGAREVTVHPHGRGDNVLDDRQVHAANGSPPRAWGQSLGIVDPPRIKRFTPTGVGTMLPRGSMTFCRSVHPHGRGDNSAAVQFVYVFYGSPPRAWGQYGRCDALGAPNRFTPTGVGTIWTIVPQSPRAAVHPHGRGDNDCISVVNCKRRGSPPRAWGQWRVSSLACGRGRFTPTGVGTIAGKAAHR